MSIEPRDAATGDAASGKEHAYSLTVTWTGNSGAGTSGLNGYRRHHTVDAGSKPTIEGSSDFAFRGDPSRWNPEELLVAALAQCHMLVYLALCAQAGVVVMAYVDDAQGRMREDRSGGGNFVEVVLSPVVTVAEEWMKLRAEKLHEEAGSRCFIASSVNFPVRHVPVVRVIS